MSRKKRVQWSIGDVFLVPQKDGKCATGQIIGREAIALNSVICAFYDIRCEIASAECLPQSLLEDKVVSILFVTRDLLDSGDWKIIAHLEPANVGLFSATLEQAKRNRFVGARIIGSGIVMEFLNAFYGFRPWDKWADPAYLDSLLISPDKKPQNLILKDNRVNLG